MAEKRMCKRGIWAIFFGTRTIFIRAVPKTSCSVNGPYVILFQPILTPYSNLDFSEVCFESCIQCCWHRWSISMVFTRRAFGVRPCVYHSGQSLGWLTAVICSHRLHLCCHWHMGNIHGFLWQNVWSVRVSFVWSVLGKSLTTAGRGCLPELWGRMKASCCTRWISANITKHCLI